jgi:fumarate hydratase, class I
VFVVGGTSAESCLKTVKLASAKHLDALPASGNAHGRAFRDLALEEKLLNASRGLGFGAQFGGKYYALDVRVVRLPRHGATCTVGMGVSCSADRNVKARVDRDGVWIEVLEANPARFIPERYRGQTVDGGVRIDLRRPMKEILAQLAKYPVSTRLSLTGPMIVARDIAHAKLQERLDAGGDLPQYFKDHPVYYAGPAKTPKGMASGSFGPTTSRRMDPYVDGFQKRGGSMVMIAKGNRGPEVADACKRNGGFYLGSIGGPAALLAQDNIRKVELVEFPELGMEAIYKIEVEDFPAFILTDDKGNDFFQAVGKCPVPSA